MARKALVLDANILVRAVLGKRVRQVIDTYAEAVSFFVPEVAYRQAEEHLTALEHSFSGVRLTQAAKDGGQTRLRISHTARM